MGCQHPIMATVSCFLASSRALGCLGSELQSVRNIAYFGGVQLPCGCYMRDFNMPLCCQAQYLEGYAAAGHDTPMMLKSTVWEPLCSF